VHPDAVNQPDFLAKITYRTTEQGETSDRLEGPEGCGCREPKAESEQRDGHVVRAKLGQRRSGDRADGLLPKPHIRLTEPVLLDEVAEQ